MLPVLDGGKVVGVITRTDMVRLIEAFVDEVVRTVAAFDARGNAIQKVLVYHCRIIGLRGCEKEPGLFPDLMEKIYPGLDDRDQNPKLFFVQ